MSGQLETTPAPDAGPAETGSGLGLLPVLIGVGGGAVLAVAVLWIIQHQYLISWGNTTTFPTFY